MRIYRPFAFAIAAYTAYTAWFALGHEAPWLWLPGLATIAAGAVLLALGMFDGWRAGQGDLAVLEREAAQHEVAWRLLAGAGPAGAASSRASRKADAGPPRPDGAVVQSPQLFRRDIAIAA